ncbi:uncharacterized protein LOC143292117 [Babylonia areolata]|uniref:uncharacterized protein LOC143292117 n=1 Tax=Babylonia areolata TaxID=304850 RepID=UPI003FD51FF9
MDHLCKLGIVFFLMLVSLTLTLLALLTDNWYRVHTDPNVDPEVRRRYNFHFGLWRQCYDRMPADIATDSRYTKEGSSCVFIYQQLVKKQEDSLDKDSQLRLHLSRTVLGCSIAAAAMTLFSVLTLICGVWPSGRHHQLNRRGCVYLSTALLLLCATMCGIASGVSFIAVRDLDNTVLRRHDLVPSSMLLLPPAVPAYASQAYDWSFMSHWVGTALVFLDSLLLMCMLRTTYQFVEEGSKLHAVDTF